MWLTGTNATAQFASTKLNQSIYLFNIDQRQKSIINSKYKHIINSKYKQKQTLPKPPHE